MLRRANEHEAAAFSLVERTMQRTRPRVGTLGLQGIEGPEGPIERGSLGRLRVRFDGQDSDFEPENRLESRPASDAEITLWRGLQKLLVTTKPVADLEGNLVSMRLGPRVLRRLPHGTVITFVPNGTPPFRGSLDLSHPQVRPQTELERPSEAELLRAIDRFLYERDDPHGPMQDEWKAPLTTARQASHILFTTLGHGRRGTRVKWHRCPLCHTPVVKGLFNPRIPFAALRGQGGIRDLRGGYLTRLRETYLIPDANSVLFPSTNGRNGRGP